LFQVLFQDNLTDSKQLITRDNSSYHGFKPALNQALSKSCSD